MRLRLILAVAVLILASCSSNADVPTVTGESANDTASNDTATVAASSEDTDDASTDDTTTGEASADAAVEDEPIAPQSVTASTIHESRTDDFPDILAAQATPEGDGAWRFDVTVSSPYDTPERYADAWRVVGPDGTEYGIRELTHDHASEQPFTRSQTGIVIPTDVTVVTVEGRDQANGWGGGALTVDLTATE